MPGDIFIIISTIFSVLCYCYDYYSLYNLIKSIRTNNRISENKEVNYFSLRIRLCVFVSNSSFLYFNIENNLQSPIISFSIFCSLDLILLISRFVCLILIRKKMKEIPKFVLRMRPTVDDNNQLYYRSTIVENPIHNTV